jgi:hypothetical protein
MSAPLSRESRAAELPGGCWEWIGPRSPKGYAMLSRGRKPVRAHRFMYRLLRGEIPAGLQLDHLCRVRHCVNPWHLEAVTARVNVLRGIGPTAQNAQKTRCPLGHPLSDENTYRNAQGERRCRICRRSSQERYKRRRMAAGTWRWT